MISDALEKMGWRSYLHVASKLPKGFSNCRLKLNLLSQDLKAECLRLSNSFVVFL